jgi:hypothetical protein
MYIALEAGIGLGAFFSGWFVSDKIGKTPVVFYAVAIVNLFGLIYLYFHQNPENKKPLIQNG